MLNKINEYMPIGEHNFDQDDSCRDRVGFRDWCNLRQILVHDMDEELFVKDQLMHKEMAKRK